MFNNLTSGQIAAFILGLIFSVLAVAGIFFAYKNADRIKSKSWICLLTMVMPFVAITCWLIFSFSFVEVFKKSEVLNVFVSLGISVVICFMILIVANALYHKHKNALESNDNSKPVEIKEIETVEVETQEPEIEESIVEKADDENTEIVEETKTETLEDEDDEDEDGDQVNPWSDDDE